MGTYNLRSWKGLSSANDTINNWTATGDLTLGIYMSTIDGFSARLFYNPNCARNTHDNPRDTACRTKECETFAVDDACMNVIYDMNGVKQPNHIGEDMGIVTVFWSGLNTTAVAPGMIPYDEAIAIRNESVQTQSEAQLVCASKGKGMQYTLPNIDELASLYINLNFSSIPYGYYWSGSQVQGSNGAVWGVYNNNYRALMGQDNKFNSNKIWCVRR